MFPTSSDEHNFLIRQFSYYLSCITSSESDNDLVSEYDRLIFSDSIFAIRD